MTDEEKENDRRIFQNEHIVGRGRQTGMQNSLLKNREKLLDEPGKWQTTNFYHNKTAMRLSWRAVYLSGVDGRLGLVMSQMNRG